MKIKLKDKVIYSATKTAYEKLVLACYVVYNRECLSSSTPQHILTSEEFAKAVKEILVNNDLSFEVD